MDKQIYEKYLQLNKNSSLKIILKKASSKNIDELKNLNLKKWNYRISKIEAWKS